VKSTVSILHSKIARITSGGTSKMKNIRKKLENELDNIKKLKLVVSKSLKKHRKDQWQHQNQMV